MSPEAPPREVDFFISRRGGAATIAQEVAEVIKGEGYTVFVQDYDIPYNAQFIEEMHNALARCRHLVVLLSKDFSASKFTMMEVSSFLATTGSNSDDHRLIVLRVDDCKPEGVLAGRVFADLVGVHDQEQRKTLILAAVEGRSTAQPRRHKLFENVPPPDQNFTGREDSLTEIHRLFNAADRARSPHVVIHGLAGIGKSSLATEYVHLYAAEYSGAWWAPAESRTTLASSLAGLAAKLDSRLANLSDQEAAARIALARLAGFGTPFLLIYDNLESPEAARDFLPSSNVRVLITTRWADWEGRTAALKLDLLNEEAAASFLQRRANRRDAAGARRLATALGCLPLALDHAGAYCRLVGSSLSFDSYRTKIDARITRSPTGYPVSVARTFSMAIEKAAATTQAETLLGIYSFFGAEKIPLEILTADMLPEDAKEEALMALAAVSLIEHEALEDGAPAVTLHRLVQAAMRAQLETEGKTLEALAAGANCLVVAMPEEAYDQPRHWPRCTQLLPHALAFCKHAEEAGLRNRDLAQLCDRVGEFLYARASLRLAKEFFRQAINVGEVAFGLRDLAVAKATSNFALVSHDISRDAGAETLLRKALDMEREQVGELHPSYARTMTVLAKILYDGGRADEAEAALRHAIDLGEKTLGRSHPDVATRLNQLAAVLASKGRSEESELLFREAIKYGERSLGREHPRFVMRLNDLALLLQRQGRADEAERLYREAIQGAEKGLGLEHPYLAACQHNYANLLRDSGRTTEAEPLYLGAISTLSENLGSDHIVTARAKTNYAKLLLMTGCPNAALEHARAALGVHSKALGEAHHWTQEGEACADQALRIIEQKSRG
jgi:tetratricopeptide (TPR) repeat protein